MTPPRDPSPDDVPARDVPTHDLSTCDVPSSIPPSIQPSTFRIPHSAFRIPHWYACLHRPAGDHPLASIAREFSPRFECHGPDLVTIDVSGLDRLIGPPQAIADELRRES